MPREAIQRVVEHRHCVAVGLGDTADPAVAVVAGQWIGCAAAKLPHIEQVDAVGNVGVPGTRMAQSTNGTGDGMITDRIEMNPLVMLGKPVIRGTRIPVDLLLRKLSEGASMADLLEAYPRLTQQDLHAAMRYAADTVAHEELVLIGDAPPPSRT